MDFHLVAAVLLAEDHCAYRIEDLDMVDGFSCFPQWDTQFLAFVAVSDYVIQFLLFIIHAQECGLGVS